MGEWGRRADATVDDSIYPGGEVQTKYAITRIMDAIRQDKITVMNGKNMSAENVLIAGGKVRQMRKACRNQGRRFPSLVEQDKRLWYAIHCLAMSQASPGEPEHYLRTAEACLRDWWNERRR